MNAKLARKRNKAAATTPETSGDGATGPALSPVKVVPSAANSAPMPPSPSAKAVPDIFTPGMSDIEKLQKLKDFILADQHPYYTSAPKVAHLLSLRVSASGSNTSVSGGEHDAEPLSHLANRYNNIPLAERLSSPKAQANGEFHAFNDSASNLVSSQEESSFGQRGQGLDDVPHGEFTRREEDVNMLDSHRFEPTEAEVGPTHPDPNGGPIPQSYQRHPDMQRRDERQNFDDSGRRSPRDDSRGWNKWEDGRAPPGDQQPRFPPGNNGRYGDAGGRYGTSYHRGGYNNQGNRRFSLNERPNSDQRYYDNARYQDKRPDFNSSLPDDRYNDRAPATGPRGQTYYGARPSYDRRTDEQKMPESPHEPIQPLKTEASQPDEDVQLGLKEMSDAVGAIPLDAPLAVDLKAEAESPVSLGNELPPSTTDSIIPPTASPDRTDVAMDSQSVKEQDETDKPGASHSPNPNAENRDSKPQETDREPRPNYVPRDGNRFPPYDNRTRTNAYQKYPVGNRNYDRPPPARDDRTYGNREPYHRPAYRPPSPPPADDRRFVPRDIGYSHEPGYLSPRREYRSGDWDMKRDDRPQDRLYDRDRRVPAPLPPLNDTRGLKMVPAGGPRSRYPPENPAPRGNGYPLPPPHEPRGYDPYADSLPPASYSRDASRVRPRSLSPRRDYRPDERPPNKRLRGPDTPYGPPPGAPSHYGAPSYGAGRAHDYPPDRRPVAAPQAAYYRPDGPARY